MNSLESLFLKFDNSLPKEDCFTCDIGNSNPHVGQWKKGQLKKITPLSFEELKDLPQKRTMISSVSREVKSSKIFQDFNSNEGNSFLGMPISYERTLGHDRLAIAHYCFHALKAPVIIIDSGTFLTIDHVNERGFQGGYIIPGVVTLAQSYQRGAQLFSSSHHFDSLNKATLDFPSGAPQSTKDAISSGHKFLVNSLVEKVSQEVKGLMIDNPDQRVICTGRDGLLFQQTIQEGGSTESFFQPHLIHHALYFQYVSTL